ncbi:MAG: hypothetical protein CMC05_15750 [Flavobacteriaceae bacterium]|jgi:hypothetical protein|nr:hypothetical protein [Flavobacteriaceae bacterium]MBD10736.1 hypothetical protein [Flavobacteriaceae bacterium]|tara:strand:+ start:658 stop:966 length:309 start_codon:yes stop_codon:yes gene_type:complete
MKDSGINKKVNTTLNVVDTIQEVKVSPFLKDRILNNINTEAEETQKIWSWFTPKLQIAMLIVVILLNVYAYKVLTSDNYNTTVEEFVDTYNFGDETYTSIFN